MSQHLSRRAVSARKLKVITGNPESPNDPWRHAFRDLETALRESTQMVELASMAEVAGNTELASFAVYKAHDLAEVLHDKYLSLYERASRGIVSRD